MVRGFSGDKTGNSLSDPQVERKVTDSLPSNQQQSEKRKESEDSSVVISLETQEEGIIDHNEKKDTIN